MSWMCLFTRALYCSGSRIYRGSRSRTHSKSAPALHTAICKAPLVISSESRDTLGLSGYFARFPVLLPIRN